MGRKETNIKLKKIKFAEMKLQRSGKKNYSKPKKKNKKERKQMPPSTVWHLALILHSHPMSENVPKPHSMSKYNVQSAMHNAKKKYLYSKYVYFSMNLKRKISFIL